MPTAEQIELVIREVANHPAAGELDELAPIIARLIVELDEPRARRVIDDRETR
jgi:hypothetical protein